ncbi:MAG TPA: chemotaxis protein CheA [bacterium]|nr:chemotaxis protein CheA [bacterium]HPO07214.1 chemotaxis protein CheA [bacterium]HQO34698.1 chemotaxis protein CheA [bacterium]HQP97667.1 chemotaxis protein CheA [bacterium]
MEFDTNQYIELFYQDAEEHLELMNEALLALEQNPANPEPLQAIFRAAHTMKSSSAMVGFMHISEFTHTMEDVLTKMRDEKAPITSDVITALFESFDLLKEMLSSLGDQESETHKNQVKQQSKNLITRLHSLAAIQPPEAVETPTAKVPRIRLDETRRNRIEEYRLAGHRIYEVDVFFEDNIPMAATRAFLICNNMRSLGDILVCEPDVEQDENAVVEKGFSFILATDSSESDVRNGCSVGQVQKVITRDVTQAEQFEWPDESEKKSPEQVPESVAPAQVEVPTAEAEKQPSTSFDRREDRSRTQTVRVDIKKLDRLLDLAGELVINRGRAIELGQQLAARRGNTGEESFLLDSLVQQGMIITQLQEAIMESRMVPVGQVFQRFHRVVRDLSHGREKEVDLILEGEETEIDKKIIDVIGDPLTHMIRNSVDHGIESPAERIAAGKPVKGKLTLAASHEGNNITITVRDDGKGLDLKKIKQKAIERGMYTEEAISQLPDREVLQIIFQPGFSTAQVVSDISGRGVGMDVVRRTIDELGGNVDIETELGKGTAFTIRLPLTLAIIQALLVEAGSEMFALPIANVTETLRITNNDIFTVEGRGEVIRLREGVVPILRLDHVLDTPVRRETNGRIYIAIVRHGNQHVGLIVDRMVNEQEIVIKSLGAHEQRSSYIAGASILGNGSVILILDVAALIQETLGV